MHTKQWAQCKNEQPRNPHHCNFMRIYHFFQSSLCFWDRNIVVASRPKMAKTGQAIAVCNSLVRNYTAITPWQKIVRFIVKTHLCKYPTGCKTKAWFCTCALGSEFAVSQNYLSPHLFKRFWVYSMDIFLATPSHLPARKAHVQNYISPSTFTKASPVVVSQLFGWPFWRVTHFTMQLIYGIMLILFLPPFNTAATMKFTTYKSDNCCAVVVCRANDTYFCSF